MKTTKTIPFDWELYNSNRDKYKVVTLEYNGKEDREITQLTLFDCMDVYCIYGVINGVLLSWRMDGRNDNSNKTSYDLQLQYEEEVIESWVNIYQDENGRRHCSAAHKSKLGAEDRICCASHHTFVKTINLNDL